jgi:arylsulfatase A-like enzyme
MTEAPVPSRSAAIVRHVQLAAITAFLAGAADGWVSARDVKQPFYAGAALGAGLLVPIGALAGVAQGLLAHDGGRLLARLGATLRWQAAMTADRGVDRTPVVRFHAWWLTVVVLGALTVTLLRLFTAQLARIKDPDLRDIVLLIGIGVLGLGAQVAAVGLHPLALRGMEGLDRRLGLPLPRWPLARYFLFVFAPLAGGIVPLFVVYGIQLGVLGVPLGVLLFLAVEGLFLRIYALRPAAWAGSRGERITAWFVRALLLGAAIGAAVLSVRWKGAPGVTAQGRVTPTAAGALRALTDVDRDGISSLYGGKDCAPFNPRRSPSAKDVPGNGVDEDCDGQDAAEGAALAPLTTYSGKAPAPAGKRLNVLLLVIDSLRADHVGLYGYKQATTPHIDEIGKDAWVFTRALSQSSTTSLSMPSVLSGRLPDTMRWNKGPEPDSSEVLLPAALQQQGYSTALVINQYMAKHLKGLQRPFQHVDVAPAAVDWRSGDHLTALAIGAIERAKQQRKPFFVTVHYDDVHHPYRAHQGRSVPSFSGKTPDMGAYDRCIASLDNLLRVLTSHLKNGGLWDQTVIIVTADHGEEFKEHGNTIHSQTCYVESLHVPLIVRIPGQKPVKIDERVALVDVVPTLVEALALPADRLELDGQSLFVPVLAPEQLQEDRPIFCSVFQLLSGRTNFFTRSVRTKRHALVHEALSDRRELYDVTADPGETRNIAGDDPQAAERLQGMLKAALRGNLWEARSFQ